MFQQSFAVRGNGTSDPQDGLMSKCFTRAPAGAALERSSAAVAMKRIIAAVVGDCIYARYNIIVEGVFGASEEQPPPVPRRAVLFFAPCFS